MRCVRRGEEEGGWRSEEAGKVFYHATFCALDPLLGSLRHAFVSPVPRLEEDDGGPVV